MPLDPVELLLRNQRLFVTGQVEPIRSLIRTNVTRAKIELEKHVVAIRMLPQMDGKKGHYVAEGSLDLLGGYGEGSTTENIRMVAGVGFEPTTFGL